MNKTKILIADDHLLIRESWSFILNSQPGFEVVAEAANAEEALNAAKRFQPHVVLMDINLGGDNGIEATEQLLVYSPDSKVLGVSVHSNPAYARNMIRKGARGYVTKNSPREEMFTAIQEVLKGNRYVCAEVKNLLSQELLAENSSGGAIASLSKREAEVIARVSKGNSSRDIAAALGITVKTVEVHRYNILRKLNLRNTAALINYVHRHQPDLLA